LVIARSLSTLEVLCIELESRKRSSGAGSEKMERVGEDREKWRGIVRQDKAHSGL
jgi:hypothetical protein